MVTNIYIKWKTLKVTAAVTPLADGSGVGVSIERVRQMAKKAINKLQWWVRRPLSIQMFKVMKGEIEPKDFCIPPVVEVETPREIPVAIKDFPVSDLDISFRSRNCLRRANIDTVGELADKSMPEMIAIRNLGRRSLNELKQTLHDMGLEFRV